MKYGYMIKTVNKNLQGYKGFQYPKKGLVEAPDWNNEPICGGGIHGLIHETKKHYIEDGNIWMVLKYIRDEEVTIEDEKIKVPRAWVIGYGSAEEMQALFEKKTGKPYTYNYAIRKGNNYSTLKAGNHSTLTAGNHSMLEAGHHSALTAKNSSTLTAGYNSVLTAGGYSTLKAGNHSTLTAGNHSMLEAGDNSICIIRGRQCTVKFTGQVTLVFVRTKKHYIVSKKWDGRKYKIYLKDNKIVEELMEER